MIFDVVFTFSRHQMKLQHRAVGDLLLNTYEHLLFPQEIGHYRVKDIRLRYVIK